MLSQVNNQSFDLSYSSEHNTILDVLFIALKCLLCLLSFLIVPPIFWIISNFLKIQIYYLDCDLLSVFFPQHCHCPYNFSLLLFIMLNDLQRFRIFYLKTNYSGIVQNLIVLKNWKNWRDFPFRIVTLLYECLNSSTVLWRCSNFWKDFDYYYYNQNPALNPLGSRKDYETFLGVFRNISVLQ